MQNKPHLLHNSPDDPWVDVELANDKAIHEEDAQQQQHASSICHHNLAGNGGHHPVDADANLVSQEQQSKVHEEPAGQNMSFGLLAEQDTSTA